MQISLYESCYQKNFFKLLPNQSIPIYQQKLKDFFKTGHIDHALTQDLFKRITGEIKVLRDIIPHLTESYTKYQLDSKNKKKKLLHKHSNLQFLAKNPLVVELRYKSSIKSSKDEYTFVKNKLLASLDKLFLFSGLYEEIYLLKALFVGESSSLLSYREEHFVFRKNNINHTFKILPIYFLMKEILSKKLSDISIRLIMEHILKNYYMEANSFITISDEEQIHQFNELCSMRFLSQFALQQMNNFTIFQLPKLNSVSKLRI